MVLNRTKSPIFTGEGRVTSRVVSADISDSDRAIRFDRVGLSFSFHRAEELEASAAIQDGRKVVLAGYLPLVAVMSETCTFRSPSKRWKGRIWLMPSREDTVSLVNFGKRTAGRDPSWNK
jgi:hypothetical protein